MFDLKALEIELHQPAIRVDKIRVTELLHPDFIEIGYSGKTWDFETTLAGIAQTPASYVIWSQSYQTLEYAEGVIQLMYLSANVDEHGDLFRHAKRTSIWVNVGGKWQMKFHQATPVEPFERSV